MKILLLGNGPTSLSALEALAKSFVVVGILREVAEGAKERDEVVNHARTLGVAVYFDTSVSAVDALVRELRPDCVVISSYNRILGSEILRKCRFLNVHYGPLPRYRGRACVNWAIINDEPCTAITIHELTPQLDSGSVLFQRLLPIGEADTVTDLYRRLNEIQKQHLAEVVSRYLAGEKGKPQVEADASYGCTRLPEDGEINWGATTRATFALIRGLTDPFPGAHTYLDGQRLVVWRAEPAKDAPRYSGRIPGRVVSVSRATGHVDVLTGDGVLRISEVELDGDMKRAAAEVIKSVRVTLGLSLKDLLRRIVELEEVVKRLGQTKVNTSGH